VKRLFPFLGVLAFAASGLLWLAHGPGGSEPSRPGSTFDTSPKGASLAFAYLQGRPGAAPVGRLTRPLRLSDVKPETVVFRLRPFPRREPVAEAGGTRRDQGRRDSHSQNRQKPRAGPAQPTPTLLDRNEAAWVEAGGRLVLAAAGSVGPLTVQAVSARPRKVHPRWPAVVALWPVPPRALGGAAVEDAVTLFASGDRPVVARVARGAGEILLLACPEVLENGLLANGDHLRLLDALAGTGRPVLFDEHAHGVAAERGLLGLLLDWGLGPSLALAALAGLALLWRVRARVGPAEDAGEDRRSDAVDLVESMGQLYERALRRNEAAGLYHEAFRRALAQRTALRGRDLDARVRQMTGGVAPAAWGRRDMSEAELEDVLARLNRAFGGLGHGHSR
jgi:hypothetical protein